MNPSSIGLEDLEWIQTFLLEACPNPAVTEPTLKTWQHYIPKIAFQNPFLLSALMAVAVLHKALMLEDDGVVRVQCCAAARRHQDAALTFLIPALSEAGPSSCVPLLCFNVLFSLLPFGWPALSLSHGVDAIIHEDWSPTLMNLLSTESMLDRFLQITEIWRGTDVHHQPILRMATTQQSWLSSAVSRLRCPSRDTAGGEEIAAAHLSIVGTGKWGNRNERSSKKSTRNAAAAVVQGLQVCGRCGIESACPVVAD